MMQSFRLNQVEHGKIRNRFTIFLGKTACNGVDEPWKNMPGFLHMVPHFVGALTV